MSSPAAVYAASQRAWPAAGSLSEGEFDQLVRLLARYFVWDVDQFDHWVMSFEDGSFFVDLSWSTPWPDAYRPVWPRAEAGQHAWTVWRRDETGEVAEVARFGNARAAGAVVAAGQAARPSSRYWVEDPPDSAPAD